MRSYGYRKENAEWNSVVFKCMKCHVGYKNESSLVLKPVSHNHTANRDMNQL